MLIIFVLLSQKLFATEVGIQIFNSKDMPDYILSELKSISIAAGDKSITVSSKNRSVKAQVTVMMDYYILCTKGRFVNNKEKCGIKLARQVYHQDCHGGFDEFNASKSKVENIEVMTAALTKSLKKLSENRICMNHVVIPGIKTENIAVDIKPSSVKDHKKFYQAVMANPNVVGFYYPKIKGVAASQVKESAFHIEFKRQ